MTQGEPLASGDRDGKTPRGAVLELYDPGQGGLRGALLLQDEVEPGLRLSRGVPFGGGQPRLREPRTLGRRAARLRCRTGLEGEPRRLGLQRLDALVAGELGRAFMLGEVFGEPPS